MAAKKSAKSKPAEKVDAQEPAVLVCAVPGCGKKAHIELVNTLYCSEHMPRTTRFQG